MARQEELDPAPISVDATVSFGRSPDDGGYLLCIDLVVNWPEMDPEIAAPLLEQADSLCPYGRMAWQGTPTTIRLAT